MPLQCGAHIPKSTSTNWRWSNKMQLGAGSASGSVSGNVLQMMSRHTHTVVRVNSDGRTCNAEAVHKWTQTGTSAEKQFVQYIHMTWWCYWSDCRRSLNASNDSASTIPLGEHSRPGWFLERRRTCRHLQTAEGAVELDGTLEGIQPCLGDLEKRVQPAMESAGLKWFPA